MFASLRRRKDLHQSSRIKFVKENLAIRAGLWTQSGAVGPAASRGHHQTALHHVDCRRTLRRLNLLTWRCHSHGRSVSAGAPTGSRLRWRFAPSSLPYGRQQPLPTDLLTLPNAQLAARPLPPWHLRHRRWISFTQLPQQPSCPQEVRHHVQSFRDLLHPVLRALGPSIMVPRPSA